MEDLIKIEEVGSEVIYQQDRAQIDIQISTAKAYPRNIKRAIDNSIAIVTMDKETAATCTYAVPRAGKAITGPSVHLARILAQNWGNLRIETKVVGIDARHITSQGICFDLENNIAIKVEVKRSIMTNKGTVRMTEDMITVTGNAGNAIALRNAILSVIPKAIVDKVYNEAKAKITGDVSDKTKLLARRKQVVDGLKDTYSLTEFEIIGAVGKASIDHLTSDDLVVLIGIGTAIKDGDTDIETAFRSKIKNTKPESGPQLQKLNFKNELEARTFFVSDQGLVPNAVEGKSLYSTAKEMGFELIISGVSSQKVSAGEDKKSNLKANQAPTLM